MAKVIAEIGINANGDVEIAKELINMAIEAGADYVKFQMRDVDTVYAGELDIPRESPWGTTQGDQKRGLEFSETEYKEINRHCKMLDIPWFASCWDLNSLDRADTLYDWPYHKIASAMVTNIPFVEEVAKRETPIIISTGGCEVEDVITAVNTIRGIDRGLPITVMHCVAQYPCPEKKLNLNCLFTLQKLFPWAQIGYSGHEVGLEPSVLAIGAGAKIVERHITLDRAMYGSDQAASMEYEGLRKLCDIAHAAPTIFGDGVKRVLPEEAECMRKLRYWEK